MNIPQRTATLAAFALAASLVMTGCAGSSGGADPTDVNPTGR